MFKTKQLKPVAEELNKKLKLPKSKQIRTLAVKPNVLEKLIKEACAANDEKLASIELTEETEDLLFEMGIFEESEAEQVADDEELEELEEEEDLEDLEEEDLEEEDLEEEDLEEEDLEEEDLEEEEPEIPRLPAAVKKLAIGAATELVKILKITDNGKNPIPRMKKLSFDEMYLEISSMVNLIGQAYNENGKTVYPQEKKEDFSDATLLFFDKAGLKPNWPKIKKDSTPKNNIAKKQLKRSSAVKRKKVDSVQDEIPKKTKSLTKSKSKSKSKTRSRTSKTAEKSVEKKAEKSRYGHRIGSMGAMVDDLVWEGAKFSVMTKKLVKATQKPELMVISRILMHINALKKAGLEITHDQKTGKYKSTVEFFDS